jgi:hypothetical protein
MVHNKLYVEGGEERLYHSFIKCVPSTDGKNVNLSYGFPMNTITYS